MNNASVTIDFHGVTMNLLDDEDAQEIVNIIAYLERRVEFLEEQVERLKFDLDRVYGMI